MIRPLTTLQQNFVNILFRNPELTNREAYIKAGYKARGRAADTNACVLLKNPNIQLYLKRLQDNAAVKAEVSVAETVKEFSKLAFSNISNYLNLEDDTVYFKNFDEIPKEQLAAVESVKVMKKTIKGKSKDDDVELEQIQLKLHSKTTALDAIMKHLGGYEKDNTQKGQAPRELSPDEMRERLKELEDAGTGLVTS